MEKAVGVRIASVLLALSVVFGVAPLEAKSRKAVALEAVSKVVAASTEAPAEPRPKQRVVTISLKQMGALTPVNLRGVDGSWSFPFSIRSDEVVVGAKFKIDYSYSPSLLPELSHLKILLNDEVVTVLPLPRDKNIGNKREIELDPRLFTDYNKLNFRLIGHYTYKCEDPLHSSLWLNLSNAGTVELTLAPMTLENNLKYLPAPFFNRGDARTLNLPFVFSSAPSLGTLKAAGIVASWFGGLASYRGAKFPVMLNALPEGNAVLFMQGSERIGALAPTGGPSISIEPHPTVVGAKLLIVSGKQDEDLLRAARAIVLNYATLTGQRAEVTAETEPPARLPYDAPAWVPTNRPVRFGELAPQDQLEVQGYFPDVIRVNFRVSPDLFTWRSQGVPMELKYRYTSMPLNKNSSLNVNVNGNFVQGLALNDSTRKVTSLNRLKLPVLDSNLVVREDLLFVPPYQVGGRNQLQLHYYFDPIKEGECRDALPDNMQGAIDPESTLDFSGFPHYVALPNLAYFSNIGFPYTRMADLSQTAVVLPEQPNADELSLYLAMMGRMGEATAYPALRHALVSAAEVETVSSRDLLVIGSAQRQTLMAKWADHLPLVQSNGERRVREPDIFRRALYRWAQKDLQSTPRPDGSINIKGTGGLVTMMAFESPLESGRSVIYLYADRADDLHKISDVLNDSERVAGAQGDFVVVDDKSVEHAKIADTYYLGSLPWITYLRWMFSTHPLLVGTLGLLICLALAVLAYRELRRYANRRLEKRAGKIGS